MNKKFSETKIGQFLQKAGEQIPEVLNVGGKILTGNFGGAVEEIGDIIKKKAETDENAKNLLIDFELQKLTFQKELYEIEVRDRESARNREVEIAKTGKIDWLMYCAGITGLGTFGILVYSVLFRELPENAIVHQLIGMVEGVAITIFAYYFGTSKGSKDKSDQIERIKKDNNV